MKPRALRYQITIDQSLLGSIAALLHEAGRKAKHPTTGESMRSLIDDGTVTQRGAMAAAEYAIERLWDVKVVPRGYEPRRRYHYYNGVGVTKGHVKAIK